MVIVAVLCIETVSAAEIDDQQTVSSLIKTIQGRWEGDGGLAGFKFSIKQRQIRLWRCGPVRYKVLKFGATPNHRTITIGFKAPPTCQWADWSAITFEFGDEDDVFEAPLVIYAGSAQLHEVGGGGFSHEPLHGEFIPHSVTPTPP